MARGKSTTTDSSSSSPSTSSGKHTLPNPPPKSSPFVKNYLLAYNTISTLLWSYLLLTTVIHLSGLTSLSKVPPPATASTTISKLTSFIPFLKKSSPLATQLETRLPPALLPLYNRMRTLYAAVGPQTTWIQSLALLEVGHVLLGWVRSPLTTTGMQVASRIYVVWGVLENFEAARTNALFAPMLIAWSITEIIRYSYYAFTLLGRSPPHLLLWLRYTTFYILYPLGAGSEAFINYSTLPYSSPVPSKSWTGAGGKKWVAADYARAVLFLIWWPGLYVMYTHMMRQRRKVLGGGGQKLKTQ